MNRRLVSGVLLGSLLLHLALLDYWRGQGTERTGTPAAPRLDARLKPADASMAGGGTRSQTPAKGRGAVAPARVPPVAHAVVATHASPASSDEATVSRQEPLPGVPQAAPQTSRQAGERHGELEGGFRAMNREEAIVALRIALLKALGARPEILREWMGEHMHRDLRVRIGADGRIDTADMPAAMGLVLASLRVPDALLGRDSEVLLSFENF